MFSDRRVPANRAFARDNPLMRIICLRLLYHDCWLPKCLSEKRGGNRNDGVIVLSL